MMKFIAMDTQIANSFREGALDANGLAPEHMTSNGGGYPCRHCLNDIKEGEPMLLLSWRPFDNAQPYAESGPIFLCANACEQFQGDTLPQVLTVRPAALVRAYDANDRILDGTGAQVAIADLKGRLAALLAQKEVASVHLRSATNSCFTCKVVA